MKWINAQVEDHIGIITLNRPDAANALSQELLDELLIQLQRWRSDPSIRVLIITGSGEKVFCAGADLKERARMNEFEVRQAVAKIRNTVEAVAKMPVPVIAAINGAAIGGGLELALACDLRLATKEANFALTETSLGIIPGAGGTQRLAREIGIQKAKSMIFTGQRISTSTAQEWGLILQTTEKKELLQEARRLAKQVSHNAPLAIRQAKSAIQNGIEVDINTGLFIEEKAYEITIPTEDRLEGLAAFKEKRPPKYEGK